MATFELTDIIKRRARELASATRYLLENESWPNLKALTARAFWLASQYIGNESDMTPAEKDFYGWLVWQTSETMGYSF